MTKNATAIILAHKRGYRVADDGSVVSSVGNKLKLRAHFGYLRFSVKIGRQSVGVAVHRLQAFQQFGAKALRAGTEARHLDGNSQNNSKSNIAIGTRSENELDKPSEVRRASAQKAALATVKFSHTDVREFYYGCKSYQRTMAQFGIQSKGTLHYILRKPSRALTYVQAAKFLAERGVSVSHKTVRRYGRNGLVKVVDLGHRTKRVTVRSLERMLETYV